MLRRAVELGVDFIDTADSYGPFVSEDLIREALHPYEGVVIAKRNRGLNSAFIVRKISSGEGVERTFQTYSPLVAGIEVKRRGDVRRAKLYYLRQRSGKSARIKEKLDYKAAAAKRAAQQQKLQQQQQQA